MSLSLSLPLPSAVDVTAARAVHSPLEATNGGGALHDDEWSFHRRAHQYQVHVQGAHAGATLPVDRIPLVTAVVP